MLEAGHKLISGTPTWTQLVEQVPWGKDLLLPLANGTGVNEIPDIPPVNISGDAKSNLRFWNHHPEYSNDENNGNEKEEEMLETGLLDGFLEPPTRGGDGGSESPL